MSNTFDDQDYAPKVVLQEVELPVKVTKENDTVQTSSHVPTTSTHSSSSHASVSKRVGCWTLELPRNTILSSHDFQTCNTLKTNDQSNEIKIKDSTHTRSGERAFAWKLSSPLTDWSVTSNTLLTVTYTQAVHAIPEYTNKNIVSDYAQRIVRLLIITIS